jgi:lipoprotein-anchoring transpeptidase ErfK/SrfK
MNLSGRLLKCVILLAVIPALMPIEGYAYGQQAESGNHVVQPGESALDLELFYNLTQPDLAALNGGQNLALAEAGQPVAVAPIAVASTAVSSPELPPSAPEAPSSAQSPSVAPAAPVAADPPGTYTVQRGDTLFRIATQFGLPMSALAAANDIQDADTIYVGQSLNLKFNPAAYQASAKPAAPLTSALTAPPPATPDPSNAPRASIKGKQIIVKLSQEMTYVYQDGQLLREFLSSTGLPGTPTVLGNYAIYVKYDSQRMVGPGYDLPGVPWVMYFYRGYALHGTYWHNNFGHPMSHGCVNLRTAEAEWLYAWAPLGTPVTVIN